MTVALAVLAMLAPFSIDTYLPSFPAIAKDLQASPIALQQTLSMYLAGFAVMTLVYGPLSDRFGRIPVIWSSLALFLASTIACLFVRTIEELIMLRFIQGLAAAGGVVVGRAMIRDVFEGAEARRVMANLMFIFATAPALAPIIGGAIEQALGWRWIFGFLVVLTLLVIVLVRLTLVETLPSARRVPGNPRAIVHGYRHALGRFDFMLPVVMFALLFGAFFIYIAASPAILYGHLGRSEMDFGYLFMPMVAALMTGTWLAGCTAHSLTAHASIVIGGVVMLVAAVLNVIIIAFVPPTIPSVIAAPMLYIVGLAFMMPSLTLLAHDRLPNHRGLASAVIGFMQTGANALVAGLLVPAVQDSLMVIAFALLGLCIVALALGLVWWRRYRGIILAGEAHLPAD